MNNKEKFTMTQDQGKQNLGQTKSWGRVSEEELLLQSINARMRIAPTINKCKNSKRRLALTTSEYNQFAEY